MVHSLLTPALVGSGVKIIAMMIKLVHEDFDDESDIGQTLTLPGSETDIIVPEPDEEPDDEFDGDMNDDDDDDDSPKIFRVIRITPWICMDPSDKECVEDSDSMMILLTNESGVESGGLAGMKGTVVGGTLPTTLMHRGEARKERCRNTR